MRLSFFSLNSNVSLEEPAVVCHDSRRTDQGARPLRLVEPRLDVGYYWDAANTLLLSFVSSPSGEDRQEPNNYEVTHEFLERNSEAVEVP